DAAQDQEEERHDEREHRVEIAQRIEREIALLPHAGVAAQVGDGRMGELVQAERKYPTGEHDRERHRYLLSMIPKSGRRFSDKIMLRGGVERDGDSKKVVALRQSAMSPVGCGGDDCAARRRRSAAIHCGPNSSRTTPP